MIAPNARAAKSAVLAEYHGSSSLRMSAAANIAIAPPKECPVTMRRKSGKLS